MPKGTRVVTRLVPAPPHRGQPAKVTVSVTMSRRKTTRIGLLLAVATLAFGALSSANAQADPDVPTPASVNAAERALRSQAVPGARTEPYAYYQDAKSGGIVVETASLTGTLAKSLRSLFGKTVNLKQGKVSRAGRNDDANPHKGGARIHTQSYSQGCSSGVMLQRAGVNHMVTAGHCYNANQKVYSGQNYFGLVNVRKFPNPDLALINGNGSQYYANHIWTTPGSPSARVVSTKWTTVVGHHVCTSGAYSLERCGATVNTMNASFCDQEGCTYNLARAQNAGQLVAQLGDSGGPVYQKRGVNGLAFQGIIVATSLNLSSTSGDTVWFHTVQTIESSLGGTIVMTPVN